MRTLPDAWRGIEIERRSWAIVRRLSADGRWRKLQRYRARLWLGSVLVLVACVLASLTMVLVDRAVIEDRLAVAAVLEAKYRTKLAALEVRRCLEWPRWCAEERRKLKVWRERGGLSNGAAVGTPDGVSGGADGNRNAVPSVRQRGVGTDGWRQLRVL